MRHEKHTIENRTNKNGKEVGTRYCLGCKDYTDNFKPQEVKMANRVFRENETVLFVGLVNQDY